MTVSVELAFLFALPFRNLRCWNSDAQAVEVVLINSPHEEQVSEASPSLSLYLYSSCMVVVYILKAKESLATIVYISLLALVHILKNVCLPCVSFGEFNFYNSRVVRQHFLTASVDLR